MTRARFPDPLPHRSGRRFLPIVAAFSGAVALHVALAAGLVGISGRTPSLASGPEGFRMVDLPEPAPAKPPSPAAQEPERERVSPEPPVQPPTKSRPGLVKRKVAAAAQDSPPPSPPEPAPRETEADPPAPSPKEPARAEPETSSQPTRGRFRAPRSDTAYLHNPPPRYPMLARRRGLEGRVLLEVRVSAKGRPLSVNVAESSGHPVLDRRARQAVQGWEFAPAEQGGRPVAGTVKVPVRFALGD